MLIRPQQKLRDKLFYNNLLLVVVIFSIICFITSLNLQASTSVGRTDYEIREGMTYGPIKIDKQPKIYKITADFRGNNTSTYLSGEVLDEDKDTLYEFGKDLWHESGYDSEGYWSESDDRMTAYLTFKEKGTYYIQFNTEEKNMRNIDITIQLVKGSYVAHSQFGSLFLLIAMIIFFMLNKQWVCEKLAVINEKIEEMSDD